MDDLIKYLIMQKYCSQGIILKEITIFWHWSYVRRFRWFQWDLAEPSQLFPHRYQFLRPFAAVPGTNLLPFPGKFFCRSQAKVRLLFWLLSFPSVTGCPCSTTTISSVKLKKSQLKLLYYGLRLSERSGKKRFEILKSTGIEYRPTKRYVFRWFKECKDGNFQFEPNQEVIDLFQ